MALVGLLSRTTRPATSLAGGLSGVEPTHRMKFLAIDILALIALIGCGKSTPQAPTNSLPPNEVVTDRGIVRGALIGNSRIFKGIPYAAPPVGALRWKPPQPVAPWQGERVTTDFGSSCVQPVFTSGGAVTGVSGNEDCLTLNVWSPTSSLRSALPVFFFMHWGNFITGGSSGAAFDGQYLAEHGPAIVVTINYRLGALGFVAHRSFLGEGDQVGFGNYGALDAIAALKWVRSNIAGFGGDPSRVVVFGQSAGAFMSCTLMTSPLARGLFSRVIMESGGCQVFSGYTTAAMGDTLAENLSCSRAPDVAACMRAASASTVAIALPPSFSASPDGGVTYRPNVDGVLLTQAPEDAIVAGSHQHVPFIISNTEAEFSHVLPNYLSRIPTNAAEYRVAIKELIGVMHLGTATKDDVIAHYPLSTYVVPYLGLIALTTDVGLTGSRHLAREIAGSQNEPVRRAHFVGGLNNGPEAPYGAFHGIDIIYLFGTFAAAGDTPVPSELALSDSVIGYWSRFASTGDPNGSGAPPWPQYDVRTDPYLELGNPIGSNAGLHTTNCDYWESVLYH